MVNDLQWWANVSQIAALVVAVLALVLQAIIWKWSKPNKFLQRIRPLALKILGAIFLFSLGFLVSALMMRAIPQISTSLADSNALPIELVPLSAFAYGGEDDPKVSAGSAVLSIEYDENSHTEYKLRYSLPQEGDGYAGLAFRFAKSQDLTDYEAVEVTMVFEDQQARCDLVLRDISGQANYVRLGDTIPSGNDITVNTYGNRHTIRIPLKTNLGSVNREFISEIGFNAGTHFTRGDHSFTVSNVRLIKY